MTPTLVEQQSPVDPVPLGWLPGWRAVEQGVAAAALIALGARQFLAVGATSGYVLALVLLPVWMAALRHFAGARLLLGATAAALVSGLALSSLARVDHDVSRGVQLNSIALLVGTAAGVGVVLWSRRVLSVSSVGLFFGAGMLAGVLLFPEQTADNVWKTGYAVPVAVIALSLANKQRGSGREVLVLLALAALSGALDSRSFFGVFVLVALLVLWQARSGRPVRGGSWVRTVVFLASVAGVVYYTGSALLVGGFLGSAAQSRSMDQIDTSGSLILGGRPELAATLALMGDRPQGLGVGVQPGYHDVLVAKKGMAELNYDPNNGYVENFMFDGHVELHSTFGDLWVTYGVVGLLLAALLVGITVRALVGAVAARSGSALLYFLTCWTLWLIFFAPFYTAAPVLMITLGLCLPERTRTAAQAR